MDRKARRSHNKRSGIESTVWIALIGSLTTIIVAILGFPPLIEWLRSTPTPIVTSSLIPVSTETLTPFTVTAISTSTIETTLIPTFTEISIASPSLTETPSILIGMYVRVYADRTTGKAPLRVKLDARDSFLRAPGGEIYGCKSGACNYTWGVYSGGQRIGKPEYNSTGTFQYNFGKKGSYFITVIVCRGSGSSDCNGGGVQIVAK